MILFPFLGPTKVARGRVLTVLDDGQSNSTTNALILFPLRAREMEKYKFCAAESLAILVYIQLHVARSHFLGRVNSETKNGEFNEKSL